MTLNWRSYLRRRWLRIRAQYKRLWKNYLYQSFLAAIVVMVVFLTLTVQHAVVIASIGATAFIIFTMPKSTAASPRRVIGGHCTGLLTGSLCALIPHGAIIPSVIVYSLAVGISIFLMVALDMEHPPASGTALGVVITGFSVNVGLAVVTSSIILSLAHHFLKRYLRDLV